MSFGIVEFYCMKKILLHEENVATLYFVNAIYCCLRAFIFRYIYC